jgi:zinc transport system substrate-binding protein
LRLGTTPETGVWAPYPNLISGEDIHMRRKHREYAGFLLLPLFMGGCGGGSEEAPPDSRPVVVTSIFPIGDLARQLAGDGARIEVLLPPGASPATFDVTPRQLGDLQGASLFLMVGGGLDEWVAKLPENSGGNPPVVRLSDGIPLLAGEDDEEEGGGGDHAHSHGSGNPHIWLDPILVRDRVLPKMEEALAAAFPGEASQIAGRARLLADSLTALDAEIRHALEPIQGRAFISTHAAWSYYAARYGLEEAGVIHLHPGQDPSSREVAELLGIARARHIPCLFTEPQLGDMAARALASELSLPTRMLDPLGGPGAEGREGYFSLLRYNTRQLVAGLGGSGS